MPVPLEKFVRQLEESGIVAGETLKDFLPPKIDVKTAEELALELVRHKKLTKFQAEEISRGKGKSLTLGNYVLMEKIGAGGMGQVFKAQHRRMKRVVAVKLLPVSLTKDPAAIARFEREVQAAAKLRHPNIIAADDADQANGVHFLVMEYVDGSDLSALVKKNGPFTVDKALNYILQAARGLEFAHAEGVVHRDVKPANLLLDRMGTVKILDMGLARIHGEAGQAELTSTGAVMGTVDYMAPEQALNTKTADARADIYALGCSLYYLLAGKATYDGDTLMAKLLAHRDQPIPSLQTVRVEVPEEVDALFRKMVAKKVEDRYQTMTDVIADLESWGHGHSKKFGWTYSDSRRSIPEEEKSDFEKFLDEHFESSSEPQLAKRPVISETRPLPNDRKKLLLIGGAILGVAILFAGSLMIMRTSKGGGTLVGSKTESDNAKAIPPQQSAERAKRAAESLIQKGGRLWIETDTSEVEILRVADVPDDCGTIFRAYFAHVNFTESDYEDLIALKSLRRLELFECTVGDSGAKQIARLTGLAHLMLNSCGLTGHGIEHLRSLTQLQFLDLAHLPTTDEGLAAVAQMSRLEILGLRDSLVTDKGLAHIRSLPLKQLGVEGSRITDAGIAEIAKLKDLELLSLDGTGINDESVSQFQSLTKLSRLFIQGTKITSSGFARLKTILPNCNIQWNDTAKAVTPMNSVQQFNSPAFQQWVKDVQALSAEQQVIAVSKKLMELNSGFDGNLTGWNMQGSPKIENGVVTEVGLFTDHVTDISPVRAFAGLTSLDCRSSAENKGLLSDLSPLKNLRLTRLICGGTQVSDLSPLEGMDLQFLNCGTTPVSDLSPLKGMHLTYLHCDITKVTDLSALRDMPLGELACNDSQVTDLSALKGMEIKAFYFTPKQISQGIEIIRQMQSLTTIGLAHNVFFSVDDFWKKYDAGEFGKPDGAVHQDGK